MFGLNGIGGFLLLVVTLVIILGVLGYKALDIQQKQATNYYQLEETTAK